MGKGWKSGRIEEILISLICVWLGWKHGKMRKMSLYKFTYKPLMKKKKKKNPIKKKKKVANNQPKKEKKKTITQIY